MNYDKNILEVYKKRIYNELLIEKREKIDAVVDKDPIGKFVNETNKNYIDLARKNGNENIRDDFKLIPYIHYTDKTNNAIEEIEKEFKDKMDDRDRVVEEVTARLQSVETYEQEMEIYKIYGIIDEKTGKIYDYKK